MNNILTHSGRYFDFNNPEGFEYVPEDIAHALSHLCRFTGHVSTFYSVAQHSVHVADLVPNEFKREALLHDRTEAFLTDISSPLKRMLPDYKRLEHRVEEASAHAFGLPFPLSPIVKDADGVMLMTECRDLMPKARAHEPVVEWPKFIPADFTVVPWPARYAKMVWLHRYDLYTRGIYETDS